jgi:hypothetical protein
MHRLHGGTISIALKKKWQSKRRGISGNIGIFLGLIYFLNKAD